LSLVESFSLVAVGPYYAGAPPPDQLCSIVEYLLGCVVDDNGRFEICISGLAPKIDWIAPWRALPLTGASPAGCVRR
jgi:hypothetical protein